VPSPSLEFKPVAALLLTGGASRRMGFDKSLVRIGGVPLALRVGRRARLVATPALEVGPGHSGLPTASESHPGSGPLAALADGVAALRALGFGGPALVLCTDLPRIDTGTLTTLANWPGAGSVVPLLQGRPQPLCARWSAADLDAVAGLVAAGERSLGPLLARSGITLTGAIDPTRLVDADTPDELDALGLNWARP
jgi:molybdopterin-guanine dinucleotide biosynthesis protein A